MIVYKYVNLFSRLCCIRGSGVHPGNGRAGTAEHHQTPCTPRTEEPGNPHGDAENLTGT